MNLKQPHSFAPVKEEGSEETGRRAHIGFALFVSLFLYGAYFYNLLRDQLFASIQTQTVLESLKTLTVPGSNYLKALGGPFILKSALFYLILLGTMLLVFMLFSLLLESRWKRAALLFMGWVAIAVLTLNDGIGVSFSLVVLLSFAAFYTLTQSVHMRFALREIAFLLLLVFVVTLSLHFGSKHRFFLKTRDRFLFDTRIGSQLLSTYYDTSPLATSLIAKPLSPSHGSYVGLLFHAGSQGERFIYPGKGVLILNGDATHRAAADFVIAQEGEQYVMTNRTGKAVALDSLSRDDIGGAIDRLYAMHGFLRLTRLGLYFFPAGLLLLIIFGIRWVSASGSVFFISGASIAAALLLFIWSVTLTGNRLPPEDVLESARLSRHGLALAYYLSSQKTVPETYMTYVQGMCRSESPALRYWGAYLVGRGGDSNEAPTLIKLMEDPSLNVRYRAAQSLYLLVKEQSFGPLLKRLLTDPSWYVRCKVFSTFLNAGAIPSPA
jgi:hypothetical protein